MLPSPKTAQNGMQYESMAVEFLKKNGHIIVQRNYKILTKEFKGEIDIISKKNDMIFLSEVKKRMSAEEACISTKQQERIWHAYNIFLEENIDYNNYSVQMQLILVSDKEVNILDIL